MEALTPCGSEGRCLAEAGSTIGSAVFLTDMLPVQLMICPTILLSIHLAILLSIGPSILLSVFPAIVLPVLLSVGAAVFLPNIELRKRDRRYHCRCGDSDNQVGDQSRFQHRVIHHVSFFCERVWD